MDNKKNWVADVLSLQNKYYNNYNVGIKIWKNKKQLNHIMGSKEIEKNLDHLQWILNKKRVKINKLVKKNRSG